MKSRIGVALGRMHLAQHETYIEKIDNSQKETAKKGAHQNDIVQVIE